MISLSNSLLNPSLYGNALTSYNPTTANLSSLYGLGSTSLSNLGLTGSSLDLPNLSALSGLYGTSDHRTWLVALANQNAQLKEALETCKEDSEKGLFGLPKLGKLDLASGGIGGLIGYFLPKLLGGGGLSKLFGGSSS